MVLIFSQIEEPSTDRVIAHLHERGVETCRINFEEALLAVRWTCSINDAHSTHIRLGDRVVDLEEVTCVWNRRWGMPFVPKTFDVVATAFAANELNAVFTYIYQRTKGLWVNDLDAERTYTNKIAQLPLAKRLGAWVPATLVSTDPRSVREFYERHGKKVIFKSTAGSHPYLNIHTRKALEFARSYRDVELGEGIGPQGLYLFTQLLDDEKLAKIADVQWAPVTFQQHIEKSADVRVTAFGDIITACKIHSQDDPATKVDFRRHVYGHKMRHELIELPSEVRRLVLDFMEATELDFGCFDFVIERETDRYYFLECNPNGQWLWIDQLTGHNITEQFAEFLFRKSCVQTCRPDSGYAVA